MKYVKVIIDNSSDNTDQLFTYECEFDGVKQGSIVRVPFGQGNRIKNGFVFEVSDKLTEDYKNIKSVTEINNDISLNPELIYLARKMKFKYMCRYIDALNCMIPPGEPAKRSRRKAPFEDAEIDELAVPTPTEEQKAAIEDISSFIDQGVNKTFLLQGVTSSGKTEVYMRVIAEVLNKGKNAIVLVPEISLTPQTIERFVGRFGKDKIAVMHSKLTKGQRYDQWMKAKNGSARIMIGARSAVFAPFENLGIIIIDEEHETTYKSDMTPRYDAIEVAALRAEYTGSPLILASATPAVVSNYRAEAGIYKKIIMSKRYNEVLMPTTEIVDMREELTKGNKSIFSLSMYQKIVETIDEGKQVILFLNKRGYSSFVSCRSCGYVVRCNDCGISMTYHKAGNKAICHYCASNTQIPSICPECGSRYIRHFGSGTEKVEEAVNQMFPDYTASRLDLDTARAKGSAEKILNAFKRGKTDILIGTQLVAKGLDFDNVGLVGVVAADITLNIPDFRAAERTFQLITQASGRAGRGDVRGHVIIQTYTPQNYAIAAAAQNDYNSFYQQELLMREATLYPPFSDIVQIILSSGSEEDAFQEAERVKEKILGKTDSKDTIKILGPRPAIRNKVNDSFRFQLVIKCPIAKTDLCREIINSIKNERVLKRKTGTLMSVDINPYTFS